MALTAKGYVLRIYYDKVDNNQFPDANANPTNIPKVGRYAYYDENNNINIYKHLEFSKINSGIYSIGLGDPHYCKCLNDSDTYYIDLGGHLPSIYIGKHNTGLNNRIRIQLAEHSSFQQKSDEHFRNETSYNKIVFISQKGRQ